MLVASALPIALARMAVGSASERLPFLSFCSDGWRLSSSCASSEAKEEQLGADCLPAGGDPTLGKEGTSGIPMLGNDGMEGAAMV